MANFTVHHIYHLDEEMAGLFAELNNQLSKTRELMEIIAMISPEVQATLDEVRQTKTLVESVRGGVDISNKLISDLQAQIAAMPAGGTLSQEDKDALIQELADMKEVNAQLATVVPAGVPTQPATQPGPSTGGQP